MVSLLIIAGRIHSQREACANWKSQYNPTTRSSLWNKDYNTQPSPTRPWLENSAIRQRIFNHLFQSGGLFKECKISLTHHRKRKSKDTSNLNGRCERGTPLTKKVILGFFRDFCVSAREVIHVLIKFLKAHPELSNQPAEMYQVASVTGKVIPWEIDPTYFKTRCRPQRDPNFFLFTEVYIKIKCERFGDRDRVK